MSKIAKNALQQDNRSFVIIHAVWHILGGFLENDN